MDNENSQLNEAIRTGRYFEEGRKWFATIYVGPIAERTFFLAIAILSVIVFLISLKALMGFIPLSKQVPVVIPAVANSEVMIPRVIPLKKGHESINESITNFLVEHYVVAREGYSPTNFDRNVRFVYGNSSSSVYASYQTGVDPKNAESFAAKLGADGERVITVRSIRITPNGSSYSARVDFAADMITAEDNVKTRWTAKLDFTYTDISVDTVKDENGEEHLATSEPKFQVVNYAVEPVE